MSALDDLNAGPGGIAGFVTSLTRRMRPVSRRDVFVGAPRWPARPSRATEGLRAAAPAGLRDDLRAPATPLSSGWTVFCCDGQQGGQHLSARQLRGRVVEGRRLLMVRRGVPVHRRLQRLLLQVLDRLHDDGICDSKCWSCSCGTGSSATCDQRRVCCNAFRYGQCNTQVKCSGGVHCRVVSCVAPYKWAACTTTSLRTTAPTSTARRACRAAARS